MELALDRILQEFPHFNEVEIAENDAWRFAKKHKIVVRRMPLKSVKGYYVKHRERHFIAIDSRLHGREFTHTLLHELCHFLFDAPQCHGHAYYKGRKADANSYIERFADMFAVVCMMPMPRLISIAKNHDYDDDYDLLALVRARFSVYNEFYL